MTQSTNKRKIKIAHSPDSDDAFMFYAMSSGKFPDSAFDYHFGSAEIEALNQMAMQKHTDSLYDVFAISFHAYAYLQDRFQILRSGASMGSATHGPRLVGYDNVYKEYITNKNIESMRIAIPGKLTSAYLVLQIIAKEMQCEFTPQFCSFNDVFTLLEEGEVNAALLIHESQLKFQEKGFKQLINLGSWWAEFSGGLNMPLGTNVIRRDFDLTLREALAAELKASIEFGIKNFTETLTYAKQFSQNGLDKERAKEYIDMYVNDSTLSLSEDDIASIKLLFDTAKKHSLISTTEDVNLDPL